MFDNIRLGTSGRQSIIVQTRNGRDLTNFIAPEPEFQQVQSYQLLLEKYGSGWIERKPATGVYNCTGHVWASRRTTLTEENEWWMVLDEDRYRQLPEGEPPVPGDIVLYVEEPTHVIMHVARVVEMREGITPESPRIPWTISKWDLKSGEVLHSVYDVPYHEQGFSFGMEFWTDRPAS